MMIKQCITVLLLVLLSSLGLAQNKEANQPTEQNQEQYLKLDYFKQVAGVALAYTPMSLKLFDFITDWIGKPYRFGGESKRGIDCSAFARELYANVMELSLIHI